MRGKPPKRADHEVIGEVLASYLDIETAPLPKDVEEKFGDMSVEDLLHIDALGEVIDNAVRIQRGFVWILIKRKRGHGDFKNFVQSQGKKYMTVWNWMCRARAYQRCREVAKYISQSTVRHLLFLTDEKAYEIAELCTGVPAEEAKKVAEDEIEAEYIKIQQEKQSGKPARVAPPVPIYPEADWNEINRLWVAAIAALAALNARLEKTPFPLEWFDRVWDIDMLGKVGRQYDELIGYLHPIEEVEKRATIVPRPRFAKERG